MRDRQQHTPLHRLEPGPVTTGGRLTEHSGTLYLSNAHKRIPVRLPDGLSENALLNTLLRLRGEWTGERFEVQEFTVVHRPETNHTTSTVKAPADLGNILQYRAFALKTVRTYFDGEDFREVQTPCLVNEPGTDVHLAPLGVKSLAVDEITHYLHTSPEFKMKQLLVEGCERIFQIASVWRGDEQTPLHSPEFSMLEWYRAWEGREAILDDTEQIVDRLLWHRSALMDGESTRIADCSPPFERLTVSELSEKTCGFDICDYQQLKPLAEICRRKALLPEDNIDRAVASGNWDELFFELQISHFDPFLEQLGAVFVTNWPARLAVLAKRREDNPQIARRFELYIGGIEIANGFVELTDPDEQAERFRDDLRKRKQLGRPQLPFPDQLIDALEWGLPPSTGIALGLDRLFMIALGAEHINQVLPFS